MLDLPHYFHLASYALLLFLCLSCWLFYHNIMPLQAFSLSVISLLFELFFELIISFVLHSPVLWFFHYFEILNSVSSVLYLLSLFCFVSFFLFCELKLFLDSSSYSKANIKWRGHKFSELACFSLISNFLSVSLVVSLPTVCYKLVHYYTILQIPMVLDSYYLRPSFYLHHSGPSISH